MKRDIEVCGIAVFDSFFCFFLRYFGNFNFELQYCGILRACWMRFFFLNILDDIKSYPPSSSTFSDAFSSFPLEKGKLFLITE